jgi:disulfide bond formation protein DsbB
MSAKLDSLDWLRLIPLGILVASAGALATAYIAEYLFRLEPCVLCLYQRVPYWATLGLGLLALALPAGASRSLAVALAALAFLAGAGIAAYHVGVERHWWTSAVACGGALPAEMTVEQLRAQLAKPPPKPCDAVDWSLFGISMSGYNAVVSALLAGAALAGAYRIYRERKAP